jgi:hypothetical protein
MSLASRILVLSGRFLHVDPGLVVDPVHGNAPDPPRSPDLPR